MRRGNYFYENASSTFRKETDIAAAGGAGQETNVTGSEVGIPSLISTSLIGVDGLGLEESNLTNFPMGIPRMNWDHGYTILHAMGMGSNSTVLNRLVETGQTASRVWSIFWGRMWNDDPMDGSVVLGGYDSMKVIGQNYTHALDYSNITGCWTGMKITITGIDLVDRTGSTTSILPPSMTVDVCIVPQRQLLMEAPVAIRDLFENVTHTKTIGPSFGLHWSAALYDASEAYTEGDMTISFSSGLQVTVPNDQFMVPFVTIARNGSRVFNDSQKEFLFNPTVAHVQPPTLGRYFLTSAYLMVNQDAATFTLWQANPSTATQLVPVLNEKRDTQACDGSNSTTTNPSGTAGSSPSKKLSSGVVAAIAIVTVVAVALIALWIFYVVRTRRKREQVQLREAGVPVQESFLKRNETGLQQTTVHEMHSENLPHEVQGSENMVHELEGRGMR